MQPVVCNNRVSFLPRCPSAGRLSTGKKTADEKAMPMPLWTLRRLLKRKKLAGSPDDSRPQTQLVFSRKQLYNRR